MHAAAGIMGAVAFMRLEASTRVAADIMDAAALTPPEESMRAADAVAPTRPEVFTHGAHAAACMRGEVVTHAGIRRPNNMAAFERKPPSPRRR
jgi:hypothetical protein